MTCSRWWLFIFCFFRPPSPCVSIIMSKLGGRLSHGIIGGRVCPNTHKQAHAYTPTPSVDSICLRVRLTHTGGQTFASQQHGRSLPGRLCVPAARQVLLETLTILSGQRSARPKLCAAQSRGYKTMKRSEDVILDFLPQYVTPCTHSRKHRRLCKMEIHPKCLFGCSKQPL